MDAYDLSGCVSFLGLISDSFSSVPDVTRLFLSKWNGFDFIKLCQQPISHPWRKEVAQNNDDTDLLTFCQHKIWAFETLKTTGKECILYSCQPDCAECCVQSFLIIFWHFGRFRNDSLIAWSCVFSFFCRSQPCPEVNDIVAVFWFPNKNQFQLNTLNIVWMTLGISNILHCPASMRHVFKDTHFYWI